MSLEGGLHRVRSRRTACSESEDDECLNPQEVKEFLPGPTSWPRTGPASSLRPRKFLGEIGEDRPKSLEHPKAITQFKKAGNLDVIKVYIVSDWAGCRKTRKSTSGGIVVLGGVVKSWIPTQPSIALSSREVEYSALVRAAVEGIGLRSIIRD